MRVLYFAWLKSRVGLAEEEVSPPAEVTTVGELATWLAGRSPGHAAAFAETRVVRAAPDQEFVRFDHPIAGAVEIAFFPPATAG